MCACVCVYIFINCLVFENLCVYMCACVCVCVYRMCSLSKLTRSSTSLDVEDAIECVLYRMCSL